MKNLTTILALSLSLSLPFCGPESKKIPLDSDTWKDNVEFTDAIQGLDDDSQAVMVRWMIRRVMLKEFRGEGIPDMTIGQALEEQRKFDLESGAGAGAPG